MINLKEAKCKPFSGIQGELKTYDFAEDLMDKDTYQKEW